MANTKAKDNVKNAQITINCEEIVAVAFRAMCDKEQVTVSARGRQLIIEALIAVDLMPPDTILRLATGASATFGD